MYTFTSAINCTLSPFDLCSVESCKFNLSIVSNQYSKHKSLNRMIDIHWLAVMWFFCTFVWNIICAYVFNIFNYYMILMVVHNGILCMALCREGFLLAALNLCRTNLLECKISFYEVIRCHFWPNLSAVEIGVCAFFYLSGLCSIRFSLLA